MVLVDIDITSTAFDGTGYKNYNKNPIGGTNTNYGTETAENYMYLRYENRRYYYPNPTAPTGYGYNRNEARPYLIFEGVTVPLGSVIDDATLTFNLQKAQGGAGVGKIYGRKTASPQSYPSGTSIFTKPIAGNTVTFPINDSAPTTTQFVQKQIDVQSIVQELVNTFDYNNDNMMFTIKTPVTTIPPTTVSPVASSTFTASIYDYESSNPVANLTINWSAGAPFKQFTIDAIIIFKKQEFTIDARLAQIAEFTIGAMISGNAQFLRPVSDVNKGSWTDIKFGNNDGFLWDDIDDEPVTVTFEDDFVTDTWDDAGTQNQVNTGTQVLDFDFDRVITTIHKTVKDLTSTSDTSWTLRWKQTNDNVVGNVGISTLGYIGMMDSDQNFSPFGAQDFIGIECFVADGVASCRLKGVNGQSLAFSSGVYTFTEPIAVNTRFWEIKRLSSTEIVASVYSDADFTNLIETSGTQTISPNIIGLQYIGVANNNQATSLSVHDGTIDDVQFFDGDSDRDGDAITGKLTGDVPDAEVKLTTIADPNASFGHILRVRMKSNGASVTQIRLMQGATIIATIEETLTSSFVTYELKLTEAQAKAITDYSDLRIRFDET